MRDTCGDLPEAKRIVRCGRLPSGAGRPRVSKVDGRAYMSGLQTCGSVWSCPACYFKVRSKRATEISAVTAAHLAAGGGALHVVVTMPHRAGEGLGELWSILSDCWEHVTSGGSWKRLKAEHAIVGYVRAAEVTHSWAHGWHPHAHVLLFTDRPVSPLQNEEAFYALRKAIRNRWCKRMRDRHGRTVSEEFGIRVDPVKPDEADGSGSYLTKVGYELAMGDRKVGRGEGHRTPFAIAHDAAETGNVADIDLFREWVVASHRKRSITWSHGLRERYGLGPERLDDDLAAEDAGGDTVAEIDHVLWRQIANRRDGRRAQFLAAFEANDGRNGITAAVAFLTDLGLAVVVDETGPIPVIGLEPPNQPQQE
ncbi:MAG: protein rep [Acidimicrobiales bacterium]